MKRKVTRREDYLKLIYQLSLKGLVRGADLACELDVSRPTVSIYLKQLADSGDITMDASHTVHLTAQGRTIALSTQDKHDTLYALLSDLGVPEAVAAADACAMEHGLSPESFAAMKQLLLERENRE